MAMMIAVTQLVVIAFFFSFGSTGAPGSPPSCLSIPASAWLVRPIGRMPRNTTHQMVR